VEVVLRQDFNLGTIYFTKNDKLQIFFSGFC